MRFRKKPVEIEAMRLTRDDFEDVTAWLDQRPVGCRSVLVESDGSWHEDYPGDPETQRLGILIPTLEGEMLATEGDWIIRGVQSEYYPCKPDIFAQTYEPASLGIRPDGTADPRIAAGADALKAMGVPSQLAWDYSDAVLRAALDGEAAS